MITGLRPIPFQHYGPAHQLGRAGVGIWGPLGGDGGAITNAVESSTHALIRPGFAGPPSPPGEGIGKTWRAYVEKYAVNNPNVPK